MCVRTEGFLTSFLWSLCGVLTFTVHFHAHCSCLVTAFLTFHLGQKSAEPGLQVGVAPACHVDKGLLYRLTHSFSCGLWPLSGSSGKVNSYNDATSPTKPKLLTVGPFTEVWPPLT